ncbi:MAG: hypothetical protein PUH29_10415, partial [Lachnospiraceae bacterium]|nr:hypothetical protein [Lachnospiraceae bacterium]
MKKNTIVKETKNIILKSLTNLIRNWYFPISSISFFCLSASLTPEYFISLLIAFIISIFVAAKIPSILVYIRQSQIRFHIVAFLTAIGICWAGQALFYENWKNISQFNILESTLPIQIDIYYFSILISVVAIFFVYFCVLLFYRELENIISRNNMLNSINNTERIIYSILIIASLIFMVVVFAQTEAFYGTEYAYDIIYVSDSPSLVKGNVYMSLTHPENDLRQPLFAVFAAPFVGIPYLIGKLFGVSASIQAMLLNSVQVVMLFVANYILTKMLRLNSLKRICFMFLTSCTYTYLLFILMMEQYVVAYFWLILFMYLISEEGRP